MPAPLQAPGSSATPNTQPSSDPSPSPGLAFSTLSSGHPAQQLSGEGSRRRTFAGLHSYNTVIQTTRTLLEPRWECDFQAHSLGKSGKKLKVKLGREHCASGVYLPLGTESSKTR